MKILVILVCILSVSDGQESQISYLKYYKNEHQFISGMSMTATERYKQPHLQVGFDEKNQAILKNWISSNSDTLRQVILSYNEDQTLHSKIILDPDQDEKQMMVYGKEEIWSTEFRKFVYANNEILSFTSQVSTFVINGLNQIEQISFFTVDNQSYGKILLSYDYLGNLRDEKWISIPSEKTVRHFVYRTDIFAQVNEIWEYGKNHELISHVALEMAPEDQLYARMPPRTGNILDEFEIILKHINANRIRGKNPEMIPKTPWDLLFLKTGNQFEIEYLGKDESGFNVRLIDEETMMTIPFDQVEKVISKWGMIIYENTY